MAITRRPATSRRWRTRPPPIRTQFPEQLREGLRPWQAKKLYRGNFGNARPDAGESAPCRCRKGSSIRSLGRSYAEISFEGRSQHKTQAQGGIEPRGPIASTLTLVDSSVQAAAAREVDLRRHRHDDPGPREARRLA